MLLLNEGMTKKKKKRQFRKYFSLGGFECRAPETFTFRNNSFLFSSNIKQTIQNYVLMESH